MLIEQLLWAQNDSAQISEKLFRGQLMMAVLWQLFIIIAWCMMEIRRMGR